jgi:hypothetical protein
MLSVSFWVAINSAPLTPGGKRFFTFAWASEGSPFAFGSVLVATAHGAGFGRQVGAVMGILAAPAP